MKDEVTRLRKLLLYKDFKLMSIIGTEKECRPVESRIQRMKELAEQALNKEMKL